MDGFIGYTGTVSLINDLIGILIILAPIVAIVLTIYFAIQRSGSDEMDQKMWGKRIKNAWICCGIAVIASALVKLIFGYYS
ncbi:Mbov_0395 family pilin-like conjugal transfer protein [Acetobacterium sp.]|uniref:Mbov_0395 family pilin-like conjugal transfer protein n=1 Tax=Acetobacterium sp. TaxID=1872094 RepID=UPI002F3ECE54